MSRFEHNGKKIPTAPVKDPNDNLDWGCTWTEWLALAETVATSTWTSTPTGLTHGAESTTDEVTSIFLTGGVAGTTYTLTNRIITNQGRTEERSMIIKCQEK